MIPNRKAILVLLVLAPLAVGAAVIAPARRAGARPRPETPVILVERGLVEASPPDVVRSPLAGRATVARILPDETRVRKGQVVCVLDASAMEEELRTQEIDEKAAEAAYQNARITLGKQVLLKDLEQARSDEAATKASLEHERDKGARLRRETAASRIRTPSDGVLVAASACLGAGWSVRKGEPIFSLAETRRPMQVNVKVPEADVERIRTGLRARIRVDTLPDELLGGTVEEVAVLPDLPPMFAHWDVKVYTTRVTIDRVVPGLRPGMIAAVEILDP